MKYQALIAGAGGLVGSFVLKLLLDDENCESICVLNRSEKEAEGKLKYLHFDYQNWDLLDDEIQANTRVFCCIGTTWKKTPNYEEYTRIDRGIPKSLAEKASQHGAQRFLVVSAIGASTKAKNFYTKMKGGMEQDVLAAGNKETYILRPAQLLGDRNEFRLMEGISQFIFKIINPLFIGGLKKYKAIKGSTVAKAMFTLSKQGHSLSIIANDELFELANG